MLHVIVLPKDGLTGLDEFRAFQHSSLYPLKRFTSYYAALIYAKEKTTELLETDLEADVIQFGDEYED